MTIRTTRLKNVQLPKTETIDLSSQMNGITQTFAIGRRVTNQDTHHLLWNSTVYRNSPARTWYKITEGGTLTTYFDQAPQGGAQRSLLLVISERQGESPTVTREELDQAIGEVVDQYTAAVAGEKEAREEADKALNEAFAEKIEATEAKIEAEETARQDKDNELQEQIDAIVNSTDVKDVVGTKAELDAYDKSTLGDQDIIKVLNDESQDGAITYYRYDKASNDFKFVGATGPYYTKAEADEKIQAAVKSANDYTDNVTLETDNKLETMLINETTKLDEKIDSTKTGLETEIAKKQDILESGTTIKTINGQSILGEGNIEIEGGDPSLNEMTADEFEAAWDAA